MKIYNGPSKRLLNRGTYFLTTLMKSFESRLKLVVVEIEEEKGRIFKTLLLVGASLLFLTFGLMSLMILIMWAIEPEKRILVLYITTFVLFLLSIILGVCARRGLNYSNFLKETRKQINIDINSLRGED